MMENNFRFYENIIHNEDFNINGLSFYKNQNYWDLIVITAINEKQKKCYEIQIENKKKEKKFPLNFPYLVISDPEGNKIGTGGSTLNAINKIFDIYSISMNKMKILLIHAGGYSQRIPFRSVTGKLFGPLPSNYECICDIFDVKMACYTPFTVEMGPGIFVTCSDDFETFIFEEQIKASKTFDNLNSDFILLAHKSSLDIAKDHGVYKINFENYHSKRNTFGVYSCGCVYQKPSISQIKNLNMVYYEGTSEYAYTDSVFFFSHKISNSLLEFFNQFFEQIIELNIEIDIYRDFLQPLGDEKQDISQYISSLKTKNYQELQIFTKMYELMSKMNAKILFFENSLFFHLGTIEEIMDYYFNLNQNNSIKFREAICLSENTSDLGRIDYNKRVFIIKSKIGKKCVLNEDTIIESSYFDDDIEIIIGKCTIINNCMFSFRDFTYKTTETTLFISNDVYFHTVPIIEIATGKRKFVTIFFKRTDDLKKLYPSLKLMKILGIRLDNIACLLTCLDNFSIWNLKFFKAYDTMSDSFFHSCKFVNDYLDQNNKEISQYFEQKMEIFYSLFDLLKINDYEYMLQNRLNNGL